MFKWLGRRRYRKRTAHDFYDSIVAASRRPEIYAQYGVADTVEGRFELLVAHMFLVLERLDGERDGGRELAQALVDIFFDDMDTSVRELGVGDMAVPKKMRRLAVVVNGRWEDYRKAMRDGDAEKLASLAGNFMIAGEDGARGAPSRFAGYMRRVSEELQKRPVAALGKAIPDVSGAAMRTAAGKDGA